MSKIVIEPYKREVIGEVRHEWTSNRRYLRQGRGRKNDRDRQYRPGSGQPGEKGVVLIDGDIGLRNLDLILGVENRVVYNIVDIVSGRCQPRQALVKDKRIPSLFLIPASQIDQKEAINADQMRDLSTQLKGGVRFLSSSTARPALSRGSATQWPRRMRRLW